MLNYSVVILGLGTTPCHCDTGPYASVFRDIVGISAVLSEATEEINARSKPEWFVCHSHWRDVHGCVKPACSY